MSDADKQAALKNLHDVKLTVLKAFNGVLGRNPQSEVAANPGQGQGNAR